MKISKPKPKTQTAIVLKHLLVSRTVTTVYCREKLAIMHPSGRIKELRDLGWPIKTNSYWQRDTFGRAHKAAQYYLQFEKLAPEVLMIGKEVLADM